MPRLYYVSSSGERVSLDGDGAYVGTAPDVRSREWSYDLGWRGASAISRDAREAKVVAWLTSGAADRLRGLADRDMLLARPGRVEVDGAWSQRAYVAKSEVDTVYGRRVIRAELTLLLLDGAWRRGVSQDFYPREVTDSSGLDWPHDYDYDYGGSAVTHTVTVAGLVPADVRLTIFGPCREPRVTVTQGTFSNVYTAAVDVPGGSKLVIDGSSWPKSIRLIGTYGEVEDRFAAGQRGSGAGSGSYCFERLRPGTSSVAWDGSFGFELTYYQEEGEPPWSS